MRSAWCIGGAASQVVEGKEGRGVEAGAREGGEGEEGKNVCGVEPGRLHVCWLFDRGGPRRTTVRALMHPARLIRRRNGAFFGTGMSDWSRGLRSLLGEMAGISHWDKKIAHGVIGAASEWHCKLEDATGSSYAYSVVHSTRRHDPA